MGERLIKPYEISVWEDKLTQDGDEKKFIENKLAVIGSDTMTGLNKVYNPIFNKKANGEKTLTFSLKYKYFDPYTGNEGIVNPFASLLMNERKVKLHYDGKWYEFIIKEHVESSDGLEWTYTCTDAFVLELSKNGYNITFDSELNNNQGTARELAKETIKDTDWKLGGANVGKQFIAEPVYKASLVSTTGIDIINASETEDTLPEIPVSIYVFYSYVKNQNGKFVQFIIRDENRKYTIDDKNVITDTNFRITTDLVFKNNHFEDENGNLIITIGEIENRYQVNRLAYNQLTTYDPVMERTVDRFAAGDREIYRYKDYTYTTSNVVMNYITNGENFNVLEDGSLQGWNPYVDFVPESDKDKIDKLELVTKPELGTGKKLADLVSLSEIEGFLKVKFKGALTNYKNAVFNSGIENNASSIESISKGQKFVFRWRAGQRNPEIPEYEYVLSEDTEVDEDKTYYTHNSESYEEVTPQEGDNPSQNGWYEKEESDTSDIDCLVPTSDLRLIVAKYTQDEPNRWSYYYKHIDPNNIIMEFDGTPKILNNIIKGGTLEDGENGKKNYVIDTVVQTPSTKYVYIDSKDEKEYVWDGLNGDFIPKEESSYLPYYYLVATAKKSIPNTVMTDVTEKIGIFIYNTVGKVTYYIQDIQLTRFVPDGADPTGETPILLGNIPTAVSNQADYFYLKPADGAAAEDIETYSTIKELKSQYGITDEVKPLYNEGSEKNLSISASKTNCFDILQTIAETFECWIDLVVKHDDNGYIRYDKEGKPEKYVYLREYAGKDNWAGFKYGINLQSIERTINSDEFVTKLIVEQSQSDYVDEGFISIGNAPSNTSGESYILNFEYYYSQGLLDRETVEADRLKFVTAVAEKNLALRDKERQRRDLEASMTALGSKRNVYTELVETAKETKTDALGEFENLTGRSYEDYREAQENATSFEGDFYIKTTDSTVIANKPYYISKDGKMERVEEPVDADLGTYYEILDDYTEEDTIYSIIGDLYVSSASINNYSGILTNVNQEYWAVRKQLRGSENYKVKVWVDKDDNEQRHVFVELNDYLDGFKFALKDSEGKTSYKDTSTVSKKFFDVRTDDTELTFTAPDGYTMETAQYTINDSKTVTFKITSNNTVAGVEDEIKEIQEQKDELTKEFNNKYSRFIQEGTWSSTDYIDSELYYLDALQVGNTSAQPTVSYTIDVVEISELEGFEWYLFDAGDKSYVEDTEFFGWTKVNGVLTPVREEVIVSEVEWHLDKPDENVITVQNYKTRFEDFFQRISATVQTVQYNEATYAKISTLLDANGTINQDVLLDSLNNISGKQYSLTTDGSVVIDGDQITIKNLTNQANRVIINSEGIRVSSDGGNTWTTAIDGQGLNIGAVYTGSLNTNEVIIGNKENPSFRWDKSGISAYKSKEDETYDLQTYVRYDQYGLYGIKDGGTFKAQNLQEVLDKAHFAVTWDGFFIKNSYEDGGKVSITSENDFQVIDGTNTERIKIGSLGFDEQTGERIYGINISDKNGNSILNTDNDGDLTITGTINAQAGEFSGLVQVGTGEPHINIDGVNSLISTSNYQTGAGWMINADGDAVFNNITARGAIKTAVFEYAEIQAVGGIFIFRPSSTIRSAAVDGNNLVLSVEKPILFKAGQWCKVSNYIGKDQEPIDTQPILLNNGLTHVYEVGSKETIEGITYITLLGAGAMVVGDNAIVDSADDLIGGALVDMGNKAGTSNYGIGINSSDNTVALPARAISLFETSVDETKEVKVSYNYRGILGTLPELPATSVNTNIYNNMIGTQGIYTDNMYLGDLQQYLAFYTDKETGEKKLKISAAEISFEIPDEHGQGSGHYQNVADIEAEGVPGPPGEDARTIRIESNIGNNFVFGNRTAILTCYVYKGTEDITSTIDENKFNWSKMDKEGQPVSGWTPYKQGIKDGLLKNQIMITTEDVDMKSVFYCNVSFD